MDGGSRVLLWAEQNGHTVTWMAEKLGYSRQRLSDALHRNDISPALSKALFTHFYLRVPPSIEKAQPGRSGGANRKAQGRPPAEQRGRAPGTGGGRRTSKLDPHLNPIRQLLANGMSQKDIAQRYDTTPSNLHDWLKTRGVKFPSASRHEQDR